MKATLEFNLPEESHEHGDALYGARGGIGFGTNHEIADDGTVTPSVVCEGTHEISAKPCTFHKFVTLEDWNITACPACGMEDCLCDFGVSP